MFKLWNWKKERPQEEAVTDVQKILETDDKNFTIEYYPITKRYYPKYKSYYMKIKYDTGIMEALEPYLFTYADYKDNIEDCQKLIILYAEHRLKRNVKTYSVNMKY